MWFSLYWILMTLMMASFAFVGFVRGNYFAAVGCTIAAVIYILGLVASIRKLRR